MRLRRRGWVIATASVAVLIGVRAALPGWIADHLNRRMERLGDYRGHLESVDLRLYRGAYRINELVIEKRGGEVPVPLLRAPRIELSISWRDLLHGALVGRALFVRPEVNFVDGGERGEDQSGRGVGWRQRLEQLFPFRLDRLEVRDGVVAFRNLFSDPPVALRAESVNGSIRNLTNVYDAKGRRDAALDVRAVMFGGAPAEAQARFDPFGSLRDFELRLRVTGVDLTQLNALARAYARLDMASGRGDFVMELEAVDGRLDGYAKPLFKDLEILDWEQDVDRNEDNPVELLWESLSAAITELFKNRPADQFATRIPIQGRIDSADADALDAIAGIVRNAFVKAYRATFEDAAPRD